MGADRGKKINQRKIRLKSNRFDSSHEHLFCFLVWWRGITSLKPVEWNVPGSIPDAGLDSFMWCRGLALVLSSLTRCLQKSNRQRWEQDLKNGEITFFEGSIPLMNNFPYGVRKHSPQYLRVTLGSSPSMGARCIVSFMWCRGLARYFWPDQGYNVWL